ncbi:MAG TPA: carbohydrate ABC transporter permease [Aggregatilinea sp.]|jgi:raffinose/stachyose/melibiose transport system permease protein|uniref:carbohydrate ABC transporter permease n=1 Tax=Aggregatilinea sp. TaxID=2806333 RepID=UPI002B8B3FB8|nr:carbohydrate ABC transporter permease [Aggregatilinea sp.]HML23427.1 carbohydrate ABC transporter permease [Aggregatilinea sp.]
MNTRKLANNTVLIAIGLVWLVVSGAPFYFMAMTGFKERFELFSGDVFAFPQNPTFTNYKEVLTGGSFFTYVQNSVLIVFVSVGLILVISSMAAYVFARMKFILNRPLFGLVIAGLVIPVHITLIPVYLFTRDIGLYDSLWALLGPYVAFNLPLSIFILTEFMRGIPREMEEAAYIDGAGPIRTFLRIMLPLSMPGLATLAIYNSVTLWNEFVFAFVLITSPKNQPLPLAIWEYQGQYSMNIPAILSVLTLSALPLVLIYIVGQEKVLRGMMAGALK